MSEQPMEGRCGARKKTGGYCEKHPIAGRTRCRFHGGATPIRFKHGLDSRKVAPAVREKIERYREDPRPVNLVTELAVQRALLESVLERLGDAAPFDSFLAVDDEGQLTIEGDNMQGVPTSILDALRVVNEIRKTVGTLSRVINETALTQAEIPLLQARFAEIAMKYVPTDKQADFAQELRSLGGLLGPDSQPYIAPQAG